MDKTERRLAGIGFDAGWDAHAAFAEPGIGERLQAAYERGWRDACDDYLEQQKDPSHPIGLRKLCEYREDHP